MLRRFLLFCGILSSLLYTMMNIFIPLRWPEYSSLHQTVSELSAIGAPTRPVWVLPGLFYAFLMVAFGAGLILSAEHRKYIRWAGILVMIYGLLSAYWPPMHLRGNPMTLTDILHIVWASVTVALMILIMVFGALAYGRTFRIYSFVTLAVLLVFGMLTGIQSPHIASNEPTPFVGLWERINIGAFLLWVIVFAAKAMLGAPVQNDQHHPAVSA